MKKVLDVFRSPKRAGTFGIEIEVEGENLQVPEHVIPDCLWKTVNDGSLRGSFPSQKAEYVLNSPIVFGKVLPAIEQLMAAQKDSVLKFSFRTSVHVHLNVQQFTEDQLFNLVYTYMLLEEPLMNFCGEGRKANRFCLRMQDAEGLIDVVNNMLAKGMSTIKNINENNLRYAALNLASLIKYGSVEFRGMRGTLDKDVLYAWVSAINYLREYALEKKNITEVARDFNELGAEGFLERVMKELSPTFSYKGFEQDVYRSFSLAIDVPFVYKDVSIPRQQKELARDQSFADEMAQMAEAAAKPKAPRKRIMPLPAPMFNLEVAVDPQPLKAEKINWEALHNFINPMEDRIEVF